MLVALVLLAFFVGGLLGSLGMALACAAYDREEFRRVDAGQRARRPVADSDISKWNLPDVSRAGRVRPGPVASSSGASLGRTYETVGLAVGRGLRVRPVARRRFRRRTL